MRRSECVWAVTITWEGNLETMVYHDYLVCLLHPSSALLKPRFFCCILSFDIIHCIWLYLHCDLLQFVMFVRRSMNSMLRSLKHNWQTWVWKTSSVVLIFLVFFFLFFHWSTIYICSALYSFDGMFLSHQNRNSRFFFFLDLHVIFCLFICEWCCIESIRKK